MNGQFPYPNLSTERLRHFSNKVFLVEARVKGYDKETLEVDKAKYLEARNLFHKAYRLNDSINTELERRREAEDTR